MNGLALCAVSRHARPGIVLGCEYIVDDSSSLSVSDPSSSNAQHRHACSAMLSTTSSHANAHTRRLNVTLCAKRFASYALECRHLCTVHVKTPYNLRPRRDDPLLMVCYDALPPDVLEYILGSNFSVELQEPKHSYCARCGHKHAE